MLDSGVLPATVVAASALRTIFHELRAQLRLRPLGLHHFRETGGFREEGFSGLNIRLKRVKESS